MKNIYTIIQAGSGVKQTYQVQAKSGNPVVIKADQSSSYQFIDDAKHAAPQHVKGVRKGKDLLLNLDGDVAGQADVIIENYYDGVEVGSEDGLALEQSLSLQNPAVISAYQAETGILAAPSEALLAASATPAWLGGVGAALGAVAASTTSLQSADSGSSVATNTAAATTDVTSPNALIQASTVEVVVTPDEIPAVIAAAGDPVSISAVTSNLNGTVTVTGLTDVGSTVRVTFPSGQVGTAIAGANGTFSATSASSQPNGSIAVQSTTTANLVTNTTANYTDTQAPLTPSFNDVGGLVRDPVTGRVTASGTGEANSTVSIKLPNGDVMTALVDSDGKWGPTTSVNSQSGGDVTIRATDLNNNAGGERDKGTLVDIQNVVVNANSTLTVTGKAEPNAIVSVQFVNGSAGLGVANASGNFTITSTAAQPANGSLTANSEDEFNNIASADVYEYGLKPPVFTAADDVPGKLGNILAGSTTNDAVPTLNGTGVAGSTIELKDGSNVLGTALVSSAGTWSYTPSVALNNGSHTISATMTNQQGLVSTPATLQFFVDLTRPNANPFTVQDDVAGTIGTISNGTTTNDNKPTIQGNAATPGDTIAVFDGSTELGTVKVASNGTWSLTPSTAMPDGIHVITTKTTNAVGNTSESSAPVYFNIDSVAPLAPNFTVNDDVPTVMGIVAEQGVTDDVRPAIKGNGNAGDTVSVYDGATLLGTVLVPADGLWTLTPSVDLPQGAHSITTTATDPAGNTSASSAAQHFTIDTSVHAAPTLIVNDDVLGTTGVVSSGAVINDNKPAFTGTAGPNDVVTIKDGNVVLATVLADGTGAWSYTPTTPLAEGPHAISLFSTGATGLDSAQSTPFPFTVDITAPAAPAAVLDPNSDTGIKLDNVTGDTTPTIIGTGEAGNKIQVVTPKETLTTTVAADGTWSVTPTQNLVDGPNPVKVKETDPAGNTSAESTVPLFIFSQPSAPSFTVQDDMEGKTGSVANGSTINDKQPTIQGALAIPGNKITVMDGGAELGTALVASNGTWSLTPATVLNDGIHIITTTATNALGNTSAPSSALAFIIDATAPNAPAFTVNDDVLAIVGVIADQAVTNDSRPTIQGNGNAGDVISIYDDGALLATVAVPANGLWAYTPSSAMNSGAHSITTTATDPAGNTSAMSAAQNFSIDTALPNAPSFVASDDVLGVTGPIASGSTTNDSKPTFSGNATPNDVITVLDNGVPLGTAKVQGDGTWSFTPTGDLPNGPHQITTTATDPAGNTSLPSSALPFTVDSLAPATPTLGLILDDVGTITGDIANGATTDDTTPTVTGSISLPTDAQTVNVYDNGTLLGTATVQLDGKWSYTPVQALSGGAHSITVTASDAAGNTSAATPARSFSIDVGAPDVPAITDVIDNVQGIVGTVQKNGVTNDNTLEIHGTGGAGTLVTVYDGTTSVGTARVDAEGNWNLTTTALVGQGTHQLNAQAINDVGVLSAKTGNYPIVLDTVVPLVPGSVSATDDVGAVTGPVASGGTTDDAQPTFNGSGASPGDTITVLDGGQPIGTAKVAEDGTWNLTPTTPLADGPHSISTTATDPAGNTSAPSSALPFTIDTSGVTSPTITKAIDDVALVTGDVFTDGHSNDKQPQLVGTAKANAQVTVSDNGVVLGSTIADAAGNWTFTPSAPLSDATHSFTATAKNAAGVVSAPSGALVLTVDSVAPLTLTGLTGIDDVGTIQGNIAPNSRIDDTTPTFNGAGAEPGATIKVFDGVTLLGTVAASSTGAWSFTAPAPGLAEGAHSVTAQAVDKAGNVSPATAALAFIVDTQAPATPTVGLILDDVGTITGDIANGATTDDTTPTVTGSISLPTDAQTVNIYDNGTLLGTATVQLDGKWSYTPVQALSGGAHSITVTASDAAGNTSAATPARTFNIDVGAPAVPAITDVIDNVQGIVGTVQKNSVTNDNMLEVHGTGSAGTLVTVYDGTTAVGTARVDAEGNWSLTTTALVGQGTHNLNAQAINDVGVLSAKTGDYPIVLDTVVPVAPGSVSATDDVGAVTGPVASGGTTDDAQPTFNGSGASPGDTITVLDGGQPIGTAKVAEDGTWNLTPTTPLADGPHSISTTATDPAGNTSAPSSALPFTVDTSAVTSPTIIKAVDDVALVTGDVFTDGHTNDKQPQIVGTAKAGAVVTVSDHGVVLGSTTADASGNWAYTPSTPLADAVHSFTATTKNAAGVVSTPSGALVLTIDTVAPTTLTGLTGLDDVGTIQGTIVPNSRIDDTTPTFTGAGAEPGATIKVFDGATLLGTVAASSTGAWSFTAPAPGLAEGAHSVTAVAIDKAGNESPASAALPFVVDTLAPAIPSLGLILDDVGTVTGDIANGATTDDTTPTVSGSIALPTDAKTVNVYDNNVLLGTAAVQADGKWNYTPVQALSGGAHSITVTASDAAGNTSAATPARTFNIDVEAPSAPSFTATDDVGAQTGTIAAGSTTDDTKPTFSGTATAGDTISVYDGENLLGTVKVASTGSWSLTPSAPMSSGAHNITTTATDPVGNTSAASSALGFTIAVDTTPPARPFVTSLARDTDTGIATMSGTGEAGAKVTVNLPSGEAVTALVNASGNWGPVSSTQAQPGGNVSAFQTDVAGNSSLGRDGGTLVAIETVEGQHDGTVIASGSAEAGSVVTVTFKSGETASANVGGDGQFSVHSVGVQANGVISAVAKDSFNYTGSDTAIYTDTVKPDVPIPDSARASVNTLDRDISTGLVTMAGAGEPFATVHMYLPSGEVMTALVNADGTWGPVTSTAYQPGGNVNIMETDINGNDSETMDAGTLVDLDKIEANTNGTLTASGTAEPNVDVTVTFPDNSTASVTVGADGKFSITSSGPQDPTGSVSAEAMEVSFVNGDLAFSSSDDSMSYSFAPAPDAPSFIATDDVGAKIGTINAGSVTDDTKPTFSGNSGTATAGNTIKVYDGPTLLGTTQVASNGDWSFTPTTPLASGAHTITTTATDSVGKTSAPSSALPFSIDTTAPNAPSFIGTDDVPGIVGTIAFGDTINDNKPTFSGEGNQGDVVSVYDGTRLLGTALVANDGTWSFTPSTALTNGVHAVTTAATDVAGNVSDRSSPLAFSIDTKASLAPSFVVEDDVLGVTGPITANSSSNDTLPLIHGMGNEGDTIAVYDGSILLGTASVAEDGTWSVTPATPLAQGAHSITTTATDAAGNTSAPSSALPFTIDMTAPATPSFVGIDDITAGHLGNIVANSTINDTKPEIKGVGAEAGSTICVYDGSILLGTTMVNSLGVWSFTPVAALRDGVHSITITATDAAGNTSGVSTSLPFSIQTATPATTIDAVMDNAGSIKGTVANGGLTDDAYAAIMGSVVNLPPEVQASATVVSINDNNVEVGTTPISSSGLWVFNPVSPWADGAHSFTATATNPLTGLASIASDALVINVDTLDPTAPDITILDGGDGLLSASEIAAGVTADILLLSDAVAGDTLKVDTNGDGAADVTRVLTTADITAGKVNIAVAAGHVPMSGDLKVTASIMDAAGNMGETDVDTSKVQRNTGPTVSGPVKADGTEDAPAFTMNLLQGASDAQGDALTVTNLNYRVNSGATSSTLPTGVSLNAATGVLTVDTTNGVFDSLASGATKTITVDYEISDGKGGSVRQTATATVTGVNDAPTVSALTKSAALFPTMNTIGGSTPTGIATLSGDAVLKSDGTLTLAGSNPMEQYNAAGAATFIPSPGTYAVSFYVSRVTNVTYHIDCVSIKVNGADYYLNNSMIQTAPTMWNVSTHSIVETRGDIYSNGMGSADVGNIYASEASGLVTITSSTPITSLEVYAYANQAAGVDIKFTGLGTLQESAGVALSSMMSGVADIDGTVNRYAVTSAASNEYGTWQYRDTNGAWHDMSASSASAATLLSAATLVRWNGTTSSHTALTMVAVDDSNTAAASNSSIVTVNASVTGGTSAFSAPLTLAAGVGPVVLDLNHDGAISYHDVTMDASGTGVQANATWVNAQDGVVFYDKYGDGKVHDASQYTFEDAKVGVTDLQRMAAMFDSNHDGVLDSKDADFSKIMVWQDANSDGKSAAGETHTLVSLDITSINLSTSGAQSTSAAGVTDFGHTTATMADGSTILVADVLLDYTNVANSGHIDLSSNTVANAGAAVQINLSDVLALGHTDAYLNNGKLQLMIDGSHGNQVNLASGTNEGDQSGAWSLAGATTVNGVIYDVYDCNKFAAEVLVQHGVVTQIL